MENLNYIKEWMNSARLQMNNSKSESIIFGNKTQVDKCISDGLRIENDIVNRSQTVKYLGAWLDRELTLKTHIKKKCVESTEDKEHLEIPRQGLMHKISSLPLSLSP